MEDKKLDQILEVIKKQGDKDVEIAEMKAQFSAQIEGLNTQMKKSEARALAAEFKTPVAEEKLEVKIGKIFSKMNDEEAPLTFGELSKRFSTFAANTTENNGAMRTSFMDEVLKAIGEDNNILQDIRMYEVNGVDIRVPRKEGVTEAGWTEEEGDRPETTHASIKALLINLKGAYYKIAITNVLLYTSAFNIGEQILELAEEALLNLLEQSIIKGTGKGQPLGIVNTVGVEKIPMTLIDNDLLVSALNEVRGKDAKKKLYANRKTISAILTSKDSTGRYLCGELADKAARTYSGYNMTPVDSLPAIKNAKVGEPIMILGDLHTASLGLHNQNNLKLTDQLTKLGYTTLSHEFMFGFGVLRTQAVKVITKKA